jgi:hypothetical protein
MDRVRWCQRKPKSMFHPYPDGQGVKMEANRDAAPVDAHVSEIPAAQAITTTTEAVPTAESTTTAALVPPAVPDQAMTTESTTTTASTVVQNEPTAAEENGRPPVDEEREERGPSFTALFDSNVNGRETETQTTAEPVTMTEATLPVPAIQTTTNNVPAAPTATATPTLPASTPAAPATTVPSAAAASLPLRTRSSCTNCRQRKQRCDHGAPGRPCRACEKGGKVCVYPGGIVLQATPGAAGTGATSGVASGGVTGASERRKSDGKSECESDSPLPFSGTLRRVLDGLFSTGRGPWRTGERLLLWTMARKRPSEIGDDSARLSSERGLPFKGSR